MTNEKTAPFKTLHGAVIDLFAQSAVIYARCPRTYGASLAAQYIRRVNDGHDAGADALHAVGAMIPWHFPDAQSRWAAIDSFCVHAQFGKLREAVRAAHPAHNATASADRECAA